MSIQPLIDEQPTSLDGQRPAVLLRPRRVLVVEDYDLVAAHLSKVLTGFGFDVAGLIVGVKQALELARHELLDAALVGINLGGRVLVSIAAMLDQRAIPFAIMTGGPVDPLPDTLQGRPCLVKPFRAGEVRMLLSHLLGEH